MDFSSTKITGIFEIFIGKLRSCQDNNLNFEPLNDSQFRTFGTIGTSGTLSVIVYYSSLRALNWTNCFFSNSTLLR